MKIGQGKNIPLNQRTGSVPNVSGAMKNWFQPTVFGVVTKVTQGFQVVETVVDTTYKAVVQPLSAQRVAMKPEGQRKWEWLWIHAEPAMNLEVDSIIRYKTVQFRIAAKKNFEIYGYVEYEIVNDYTGAGPTVETP
jgi:hypothetical protein